MSGVTYHRSILHYSVSSQEYYDLQHHVMKFSRVQFYFLSFQNLLASWHVKIQDQSVSGMLENSMIFHNVFITAININTNFFSGIQTFICMLPSYVWKLFYRCGQSQWLFAKYMFLLVHAL